MARLPRHGAKDFTKAISYAEYRWLTRWPWLLGAGCGIGGLLVGLLVGALSKQCGGW